MPQRNAVTSEVKELREDLHRLRGDLSNLASALLDAGVDTARDVKDRTVRSAEAGVDRLAEFLHTLRSRGDRAAHRIEDGVRRHPFVSLLMAMGLGFLLSRAVDGG
jgi:ElaB/YqjD/DUF883 family membrane-anchored ribosome-binding protein